EAITKEMHDGLGRATTTASSLEAEQDSGPYHSHQKVKKLEKKLKHKRRRVVVDSSEDEEASLDKEDSRKQGRVIKEINKDENVNLVKSSKQGEAYKTAGHRMESDDIEVADFSTTSPQKDDDEKTLAETLVNIKKSVAKDKGKAIMQESEHPKKTKKKEMIHISLDEEIAQRFYEEEQAQLLMDEEYAQQVQAQWVSDEARIAQENLAQAEQWDDVQAHIQADKDLAQRMLEEERKSLSIKEMSRLLTEFIDQRKKMLAIKKAEEKRNKPPTHAQQRTYMSNYIKNMGGYTHKQLK
nr:hypothetical protein [Tanacetum cinerariifolium]